LGSITLPAAFVNNDLSIRISNDLLREMIDTLTVDLLRVKIGKALECAYVSEHTRCGEEQVCLQCGVRRMVDLARITGNRFVDVPLCLQSKSRIERKLLFTFAKAGDAVLIVFKSASV
jgi:hypothetical protein